MANTPYMNVALPTVGGDANAWGTELNTGLGVLDSHDHTAGKGTPVPTAGINIDADLDMNGHSPSSTAAVKFSSQSAGTITTANAVQVISGDLWYNNNSGTPVQITSGNSITSSSSPLVPSGVIWPYGGVSAPTGFLLCDGSSLLRASFSDLFAAIGTTYGTADSTHFNIPNMNGRIPVGAGTYTDTVSGSVTRTLGASLGAEKHVLVTGELASHTHTQNAHTHTVSDPGHSHIENVNNGGGGFLGVQGADSSTSASPTVITTAASTTGITNQSTTAVNQSTGSGTAHNNMQPSVVVNYIIKT